MSYDFQLFRVSNGVDPISGFVLEQKARAARHKRDACDRLVVNPLKEEEKRRLSDALIASYPDLRLFERDYMALAKNKSIGEEEARYRYRDLELNDLRLGLQVHLFDDTASITLGFERESKDRSETRLRAAWTCVTLLEREGAFSTYDPQLGKILKLEFEFQTVLATFLAANEKVNTSLRQRHV